MWKVSNFRYKALFWEFLKTVLHFAESVLSIHLLGGGVAPPAPAI